MTDTSPVEKRRRFPAAKRVELLIGKAAEVFAEDGFSISTREIADRCGVTQALLYKYFRSKTDLIDAVMEARFLSGRSGPDIEALKGDTPLEDRIATFYLGFLQDVSEVNTRIFLRAALDRLDLPSRYGTRLDERILGPVLNAVRRDQGQEPSPVPLARPERELAMLLHGGVVFMMIRRVVYRTPFPDGYEPELRRLVRVWLVGAGAELSA